MFLDKPWPETTFIALDLETTGKYPLEAEICEMAAVKWQNGKITGTFQSLIKPHQRMSDEVIAIHNITNEMVETSPRLEEKLGEFHKFISDGITLAHHIPFDMGFLSWDFEKARLPLPAHPALCTSLLSRALNFNVANHRMPTLKEYFKLPEGQLHRAMDDAQAALQIALKYFEKAGPQVTVRELIKIQAHDLNWPRFSIEALYEKEHMRQLVRAVVDKREVMITYNSGSKPGQARKIMPMGIVRNPDGDFLAAVESHRDDTHPKRYYLAHISAVTAAD
jgi:DNA polymerase-3 subunit epsilon